MDINLIVEVYPFFFEAAWVTIQIAFLSTILGLICGAFGAAARLSRLAVLRVLGAAYVSVIRGTPALIQVFLLYFGGPQIGIQLEAFEAGVIALGFNIGAYMTESIRGAIIAVDKGQNEASRTLGIGRFENHAFGDLAASAETDGATVGRQYQRTYQRNRIGGTDLGVGTDLHGAALYQFDL